MNDDLRRIADALDRLSPPPPPAVSLDASAYCWQDNALVATAFAPMALKLLTGIDAQKDTVVENLRRLVCGHAAHDMLLWGARGTGKSALVKAAVAATGHGLMLVELSSDGIASLPRLFARLADWDRPALVFIDDVGFDDDLGAARQLRSVLDGGSAARPAHVRIAVTSNRRHIVARDMDEQASAINARDVADDRLALADRFGLSLGFHNTDQPTYLTIVAHYAEHYGLPLDPADAVQFATQRGSRSGRVAWHYIVELLGRADRPLWPVG